MTSDSHMPPVDARPASGHVEPSFLAPGAVLLLLLAWIADVALGFITFYFDPDDLPGSYYEQRIPLVVAALAATGVLYLSAATVAAFAIRRRGAAAIAGWIVIICAGIGLLLLSVYGGGGLDATIRFANTFPG